MLPQRCGFWVSGIQYKFVVDLDTLQDEPDSRITKQVYPFFFICGIDMIADIACPVNSSCFGVSNISNVVDVTLADQLVRYDLWIGEEKYKKKGRSIPYYPY